MKLIQQSLFILCLLFSLKLSAQKEIPSFGKIDKADLEMKDCDFDPGAVAVKLLDVGDVFYDRGTAGITFLKTIYNKRVRIKILKDKGLSYANVEIPFFTNGVDDIEKIRQIDACIYNLDETGNIKVTNVGKSSIYIKKINKRFSRLIIAFPEAKVGSVVEYRYRQEVESYSQLKDWYFQDVIPTRYSEYEIKIPDLFVFNIQRAIVDKIDEKQKTYDDVITINDGAYKFKTTQQNFIMRNLVGIKDEPFMPSAKDYLQRLEFTLSQIDYGNNRVENLRTTWTDVVTSLMKDPDFGLQLKKDIPDIGQLLADAAKQPDKEARIKFIYNGIRLKIRCDDHEAIYSSDGIVNAWQNKAGNIADINIILINVLNKAGIKAKPILLSTRDNGLINSNYPSLSQFNVVMAYVATEKGFYVLDATDKYSNYKLTAPRIVNTRGFLIDPEIGTGKVVDVVDNTHSYQILAALKGVIDEKLIMTGECAINCMDYARKQRVDHYMKNAADFKNDYFIKPYPAVSIQEISFKNSDVDSLPFTQKVSFTTPLNNSGEYSYFTTNLFADFEKNPFIEDQRNTDVDFGFTQDYTIYGNFTIPADYVYETLPVNISMSMPDKTITYTRSMEANDKVLNMKITVEFKSSFYPAASYPVFHEFYKKLFASLNEQVVIKKKK